MNAGTRKPVVAILAGLFVLLLINPLAPVVAVGTMYALLRTTKWHWHEPLPVGGGLWAAGALLGQLSLSLGWLVVGAGLGVLGGAAAVGGLQVASGRAEWHPMERRRRLVDKTRRDREIAQALANPEGMYACTAPPVGLAVEGDLVEWRQGRWAVMPGSTRGLGFAIVGGSGSGKTVTIERLVASAAQSGRKVVLADCKGTDPDLPARVLAAYLAYQPGARVAVWPAHALDMWRGSPGEVAARLLAVMDFTEPFYRDATSTALRLALSAPGQPPVRSSAELLRRLTPEELRRAWAGRPQEADAMALTVNQQALPGVRLRYSRFFDTLAGRFDGHWSWEDVDVVMLSVPSLASRDDADAVVRVILADWAHYCAVRKPRVGEDALLIVDEYSAIRGGAELATHLAERVRDVGGQVIVTAQSWQGLGDTDDERRRLVGAMGGGLILHRVAQPDELVTFGGTVRRPEQSWQLDHLGQSGMGSVRMGHKLKVDPDQVRQAAPGEAWVISHGRYLRVRIVRPRVGPDALTEAQRRLEAAEPVRTLEAPSGADPEWLVDQPAVPVDEAAGLFPPAVLPAVPQDQLVAPVDEFPGLFTPATPSDPPAVLALASSPAEPPTRVKAALAAAVRAGSTSEAQQIVDLAQRTAPAWDGQAELARLVHLRESMR